MNANWFDALSREIGRGRSRRDVVRLLAKTTALAVFGSWLRPGRVQGAQASFAQDPDCNGIRTFYRPDCPNPVPKRIYTPSVNGCGPEGGVFGTGINAVPNSPLYLTDFTPACDGHDRGYGTCNRPKDVTDRQFLHDMYAACGNEYPGSGMFDTMLRIQCKHAAHTYRDAVRKHGEDAYRAGQAAACDCCDPSPCAEPSAAAAASSTQDNSPGFSSAAPASAAALVCRPSQAMIVVNAREDDGRTITFRSIVNLTNTSEPGLNGGRTFRGKGTGPYREQFISEQCGFTITWTGEVGVDVSADLGRREVQVGIAGPVRQVGEWPGTECLDGTYYAPNRPLPAVFRRTCRFDTVDFARGGVYKAPPPEETADPYSCTLTIGPLISPTPTPGAR